MLNKKVEELLNRQINREYYSAYLYLDFSNYYRGEGLNGFGNWFSIQAQEEKAHAQLFIDYVIDNGGKVKLGEIGAPDAEYGDFGTALNLSLGHERFVTASIYEIYEAAVEAKDYRTQQFLDWFVKEQAEEEKNAEELIQKYKLFGADGKGLYLLNTELAARVFTAPSIAAT